MSPNVSIETFSPYRLHQSLIPNVLPGFHSCIGWVWGRNANSLEFQITLEFDPFVAAVASAGEKKLYLVLLYFNPALLPIVSYAISQFLNEWITNLCIWNWAQNLWKILQSMQGFWDSFYLVPEHYWFRISIIDIITKTGGMWYMFVIVTQRGELAYKFTSPEMIRWHWS